MDGDRKKKQSCLGQQGTCVKRNMYRDIHYSTVWNLIREISTSIDRKICEHIMVYLLYALLLYSFFKVWVRIKFFYPCSQLSSLGIWLHYYMYQVCRHRWWFAPTSGPHHVPLMRLEVLLGHHLMKSSQQPYHVCVLPSVYRGRKWG